MKISVDLELCEANGVCMGVIPEVFDLDDNDHLTVLRPHTTADDEELIADAVRQCPRQAILLVED